MADGKRMHGGLADRLRGICSLYESARDSGMDFRIFSGSHSGLRTHLIPAGYDWRIADNEISFNSVTSRPVHMDTRGETDSGRSAGRNITSGKQSTTIPCVSSTAIPASSSPRTDSENSFQNCSVRRRH